MPSKRSGASQKRKATTDTSFLSKLQMLRDFVGDAFSESDLSACLRQCGCNIERAAELLMTGQYHSKEPKKQNNNSFFAAKSNASAKSTTTSTPANKRHRATPAVVSNVKKTPAAAASKQKTSSVSSVASTPSNNKTAVKPSHPVKSDDHDGRHLWLCERWIVGLSTTKNGRFRYQEKVDTSHSLSGPAMVRFRGSNIEGTLRPNVCALLTPLLREEKPLISMEAHALMEERGVPIGGDVPLCVRIFIEDPVAFFGLFETNDVPTESAASQFFGSTKPKGKGRTRKPARLPIAEAAFALLQWAQYGDDPTFEPPEEPKTESEEDSDEEDMSVMKEDEFEAEAEESEDKKETAEWAKNVVDETSETIKEMELPEASDPVGFTNEVVLRPYQRQALHWMLQRESGNDNREELEKELSLLAELTRNSSRLQPTEPTEENIVCEVGPVRVSQSMALQSRTVDGVLNPVNHPLWERRFVASADKESAFSFYVNELLGVASSKPPNPPKHCTGGILADAMGLGKTVMLMALILKDKELSDKHDREDEVMTVDEDESADKKPPAREETGTTLVVAPLSLISQWEEELATKTNLSHRMYYAESAKGGVHSNSFKGVDVVVTTYGTIQGELLASKKAGTKSSGLLSYNWHRVILDESHCIKNPSTYVSRACCMLKADKRWCVTGTPIQNSLQDVYALLKFLRHEPWCETGFWKAAITNAAMGVVDNDDAKSAKADNSDGAKKEPPQSQESAATNVALSRVKRLLAPLILRRTKDTLNKNGQPILTLPPMEVLTINVELSAAEREFYNSLLQKSQSVFEGFIKSGTASKSWFAIFSLLNRLRQTCDHVALTVKSQLDEAEWNPDTLEVNDSPAKKKAASPSPAKRKRVSKDKDALGEEFLEELLVKFRTKQDKENVEMNYASQVAHALAKTIKSSATMMEDECPICLDCPLIHETVITPCAHVFCRDCLVGTLKKTAADKGVIQQCPDGTCPSCNETIDAKRIIMLSKAAEDGHVTTSYLASPKKSIKNGKAEPEEPTAHLAARQTLEKALRGAGSAKLTAVIKELHNVWEQDPRSKVLIFSQYLGCLDLLEAALRNHGIPSGRLDGKLSLKERVSVLEKFRQDTHPPIQADDERSSRIGSVLLMSMKAGGVGINATAASSVFIVDPWWNGEVEDQCVSRIHRIGQTAEIVRVRKFVVKDSVEERIVMLQRRKKDMACKVLNDVNNDEALSNSKPTLEDFKILFGG